MKKISIIGSTGSIGKNSLEVISNNPGKFSVFSLAAKNNVEELINQANCFKPKQVVIYDEAKKAELIKRLKSCEILCGSDGLVKAVTHPEIEQVLLALTGAEGLSPLIAAIRAGKNIALANKEPLVMAGEIIRKLVGEHGVQLIPIDSEHSGIFQCLDGRSSSRVSRIFLTASGGPFLNRNSETFDRITPDEAVQHPRWNMGKKISVDSATLMNKGLEVIEASALFGIGLDQIEVLIHPEAVVHSIVEFEDGSQIAQMSVTDMQLPIQYALSYPKRFKSDKYRLDLSKVGALNFQRVDTQKFPCLALAYRAGRMAGTAPCVLNAANEVCVESFLKGEILFTDIPRSIEAVLASHSSVKHPNLDEIFKADVWARNRTNELIHMKVSV
ncbi:MAG: 1-deoxy-D-xylulose-5-phosphate reductoisomerase [Candidatus Omnitrophica bacterium]|nr:1-deoxy-D-xylulose-5-phosphate reductoisomerase [Candidatus Omnitrophota bacterium]